MEMQDVDDPLDLHTHTYIYIYQHLQRGVKWFLRGVNSPSLRV